MSATVQTTEVRGRTLYRVVEEATGEELRPAHWNQNFAIEWANGYNAAVDRELKLAQLHALAAEFGYKLESKRTS